ncbi:helix-turn-helix domain-containing protein, partial [Rhizobium hidalgonense]|uniref:helix-turn-helix domain-containing protein n=1 Tax=Rhizobium hidalgonense TaxID=1538159 RepID=UPI0028723F4D
RTLRMTHAENRRSAVRKIRGVAYALTEIRLLAIAHALIAASEIGLKEHDRLVLAKKMMKRKLEGRRTLSKLPELVELVMAKPLGSAGVAKTLDVTPQAARRIVLELGLRERKGRYRAWGIF